MTAPSPSDVLHFRENQRLTQATLAELLGTSVRTVQSWEAGARTPPVYLARALRDLERELSMRRAQGDRI